MTGKAFNATLPLDTHPAHLFRSIPCRLRGDVELSAELEHVFRPDRHGEVCDVGHASSPYYDVFPGGLHNVAFGSNSLIFSRS